MNILVGCEESQTVTKAFRARGHKAFSCDLELCSGGHPEWHIRGDVFDLLVEGWDMLIFHWPCTYMLNAGVRWFTTIPKHPKPGILYGKPRHDAMKKDAECFKRLLNCGIPRICGENPIMCGEAQAIIGTPWTQTIQPWQFGHGETKRTCLWLKNLPPLVPTDIVAGREQRIFKMSPGPDRSKMRSKTYPGIANAMAIQWG